MKPLLTSIAAAIVLLLPAPGFSAYIIHLHDGARFVTDQYFEEGDQIKFKRYGGAHRDSKGSYLRHEIGERGSQTMKSLCNTLKLQYI